MPEESETELVDISQYKYQIKAVNRGNVLIPAIYGESMYIPTIYYRGGTIGNLIIE